MIVKMPHSKIFRFFKVLNSIIPCSKRPLSPLLKKEKKRKENPGYRALSVSA